jgi:hypothetical protein
MTLPSAMLKQDINTADHIYNGRLIFPHNVGTPSLALVLSTQLLVPIEAASDSVNSSLLSSTQEDVIDTDKRPENSLIAAARPPSPLIVRMD